MLNLIAACALTTLAAPAPQAGWLQDFDKAMKIAVESERDLLVEFSGSDWCPWCKKMEAAVFGRSEFVRLAEKQYVLVKVDLPRNPQVQAKIPNHDNNQILAQQYRVESFPTVFLMTPGGEAYASTGYVEDGAKDYWARLSKLRTELRPDHVEALRIIGDFASADEEERATLAAQGLALYPKLPKTSPLLRPMVTVLAHYQILDARNEAGNFARMLKLVLPDGFATRALIEAGQALDPQNTLGVCEMAVYADCLTVYNKAGKQRVATAVLKLDALGPIRDERAARALYANGCQWVSRVLGDLPRAKELANKALPYVKEDPQLEEKVRQVLRKAK